MAVSTKVTDALDNVAVYSHANDAVCSINDAITDACNAEGLSDEVAERIIDSIELESSVVAAIEDALKEVREEIE